MNDLRDNKTGRFRTRHGKPMAKKLIGLRLPEEMDAAVREAAGEDLSEWIRIAIAEKLARDSQQNYV